MQLRLDMLLNLMRFIPLRCVIVRSPWRLISFSSFVCRMKLFLKISGTKWRRRNTKRKWQICTYLLESARLWVREANRYVKRKEDLYFLSVYHYNSHFLNFTLVWQLIKYRHINIYEFSIHRFLLIYPIAKYKKNGKKKMHLDLPSM